MKKWAHELNKAFSKEEVQITSKYMKNCSTSLVIKQMKIKTPLRFHLTSVIMSYSKAITTTNVGEDMMKQKPL
jgi:hypothetical protein